jgi:outer membrane lipopolysaccharide assembly protein LptE/RlpB
MTVSSGQGATVGEIVKNKLKVVCDSYDKARLVLIREMQKYEKLLETIMADASCNEDEVLFNVRGELVTASRASLINNTTTTNRTYFYGLLSSGAWKSDIIGMCAMTLQYDWANC